MSIYPFNDSHRELTGGADDSLVGDVVNGTGAWCGFYVCRLDQSDGHIFWSKNEFPGGPPNGTEGYSVVPPEFGRIAAGGAYWSPMQKPLPGEVAEFRYLNLDTDTNHRGNVFLIGSEVIWLHQGNVWTERFKLIQGKHEQLFSHARELVGGETGTTMLNDWADTHPEDIGSTANYTIRLENTPVGWLNISGWEMTWWRTDSQEAFNFVDGLFIELVEGLDGFDGAGGYTSKDPAT